MTDGIAKVYQSNRKAMFKAISLYNESEAIIRSWICYQIEIEYGLPNITKLIIRKE